jgi:hypothetical protein
MKKKAQSKDWATTPKIFLRRLGYRSSLYMLYYFNSFINSLRKGLKL